MIVLLNGWIGWRAGLIPLEHGLRQRLGRRVVRGNIGVGMCCIRRSSERAAEQIDQLARTFPGQPIDVIGHSMGGLIAAYVLKHLDRGRHVRAVITLGTPHRGSPLARVAGGVVGLVSTSLVQMIPESAFLEDLAAAPVPLGSQLVSIAAIGDTLVPSLYAQLARRPRQFNRHVQGGSHLGLLFSREVLDTIQSLLRPRAKPSSPSTGPQFAPAPALALVH